MAPLPVAPGGACKVTAQLPNWDKVLCTLAFYTNQSGAQLAFLYLTISLKNANTADKSHFYIVYGFERSIVENLRTDSLMLGGIRISVLVSVIICLTAAVALIVISKKQKIAIKNTDYIEMFHDEYEDIQSEETTQKEYENE